MNAHTPRREIFSTPERLAEDDRRAQRLYKLTRIAELARAGSIVIEHQLGGQAPAAMLDAILSAIEDEAEQIAKDDEGAD